jgi:hypothetical protein
LAIWQPNLEPNKALTVALHQPHGSGAMGDYRAYILGIDGHRFVWAEDFPNDHPHDGAAMDAARQLSEKHDVEVWDGGRLVARLSPGGEVMSPGLVPSLVFAPPSDRETSSVKPAEPISLSKVSELALAASSENNLFL